MSYVVVAVAGAFFGVLVMCLCQVAGKCSREEEKR